MLVINVEFLAGRYVATCFNDRNRSEWPPHPGRLFSAMVAAWADGGQRSSERAALEWLERQDPPAIVASDAAERTVVTHYVPDNDVTVLKRDLTKLFSKRTDVACELAAMRRDGGARRIATLERTLDKHDKKIAVDSAKTSAASLTYKKAPIESADEILPDGRGRQARTFPTEIPEDPQVRFAWNAAEATTEQRDALDAILARIPRLGHSSSPVTCWISDEPTSPATYFPCAEGKESLRVPTAGTLVALEDAFAQHQGNEPRLLPTGFANYRKGDPVVSPPRIPLLGGDWFVLRRKSGPNLSARRTLNITRAVVGAIKRHAGDDAPELISGHKPGPKGEVTPQSERPHVAVVGLPFVGAEHADGRVLGAAVVLPAEIGREDRSAVLRALGRWRDQGFELRMGGAGVWKLELESELPSRWTLDPQAWRKPARRWASATPVALDRFPGKLNSHDSEKARTAHEKATATIGHACTLAGLPTPVSVELEFGSPLRGVPPLGSFPVYRPPDTDIVRACVHARIEFDDKVAGPFLIGAGRYYGYGLFWPISDSDASS